MPLCINGTLGFTASFLHLSGCINEQEGYSLLRFANLLDTKMFQVM